MLRHLQQLAVRASTAQAHKSGNSALTPTTSVASLAGRPSNPLALAATYLRTQQQQQQQRSFHSHTSSCRCAAQRSHSMSASPPRSPKVKSPLAAANDAVRALTQKRLQSSRKAPPQPVLPVFFSPEPVDEDADFVSAAPSASASAAVAAAPVAQNVAEMATGGLQDEPDGPSHFPSLDDYDHDAELAAQDAMMDEQQRDSRGSGNDHNDDSLPPLERATQSRADQSAAAAAGSRFDFSEFDGADDSFLFAAADAVATRAPVAAAPVGPVAAASSPEHKSALATLKKHWGYDSFRPGQFELIDSVARLRRDAYVLMATGAGQF